MRTSEHALRESARGGGLRGKQGVEDVNESKTEERHGERRG